MKRSMLAGIILCYGVLSVGNAIGQSLIIDLPELSLAPNTANQTVDISVLNSSGGNVAINGLAFNLQVADTGPSLTGSIDGPEITAVDIVSGTVFDGVSQAPSGAGQFAGGQLYNVEVLTLPANPTVDLPVGSTKIATVTFDTTSFFSGVFNLTLNTVNAATRFTLDGGGDLAPTLQTGSLTIVPEPGEMVFFIGIFLGLFVVSRRILRDAESCNSGPCFE